MKDNSEFDILRLQIDLFSSYIKLSNSQRNLLSEADSLGTAGDYETGLIYLEEILEGLNIYNESVKPENIESTELDIYKNIVDLKDFSLSFITGIDFDKHEFEYGYEANDSTILEELNKPYAGFSFDYILFNSEDKILNLYNSLRYDSENIRNNYQLSFTYKNLDLKYGGYLNNSNSADYSSYWENSFQVNFDKKINERTIFTIRNIYNYKTYERSDLNYTDYFRNFFDTSINYQLINYGLFAKFENEINEYLGNDNYDYKQNRFEFGYKNPGTLSFQHSASLGYEIRDYTILYGDSTISNNYKQLSCLVDVNIPIYKSLNFQITNNIIKKIYTNQSIFEPNYVWIYFKPFFEVDVFSSLQLGAGYEWENKSHSFIEEDGVASTEQNYQSRGLNSSLNYFSPEGITFSVFFSYQSRRYPESPINDLINLYSSRNVFSLIALGNFPVTNKLNVNIMAVYDNDKDIDNDQGNTQSSIFNIELEYKF